MSAPLKGWAWPYGCAVPHYFVGPRSLCGQQRLVDPDSERLDTRVVDKNDCAECIALLKAKAHVVKEAKK